jgi:peptidoglycan/LPS O-acetylase OafA/YrhL
MGPVELILLFATSALAALALHWFIERPARAVLRRKMAKGHNDPEPPVLRSEPL